MVVVVAVKAVKGDTQRFFTKLMKK